MELFECYDNFMRGLSRQDHEFTARLEAEARNIRSMILRHGSKPPESELHRVKSFLLDVEKWKADCREEQTGNAFRNEPDQIWSALRGAVTATSDLDALISIMNLIGFGSSRDEETGQRRAKRATAVLRFLDPDEWGVVDWRTIAILSLYEKHGYDMDNTIEEARRNKMQEMASLFELVNEELALDEVKKYRNLRNSKLPRTVNVELALYGASFLAWPRLKERGRRRRS